MPALADNPQLLTVTHAAALLNVSRSWLYAELEAGRIPYRELGHGQRRGRMLRIDFADLSAIVDARPQHKAFNYDGRRPR